MLTRWWQQFHDPVFNELVQSALAASPDTRTAISKIAESRARRRVEIASFFPWITGSASAQNSRTNGSTGSAGGVTTATPATAATGAIGSTGATAGNATDMSAGGATRLQSYQGSFDASWQVDLFGKQWQNVKARSADLAQAAENYYGAQVSLAADVVDAYVTLRQAEGQLAVVQRSIATRTETLQVAEWREEAGQGSALDTQQSLSTLEDARASVPSLKETIGQTRNKLALLLGRTPGGVDQLVAESQPIPDLPARITTGIPADTLRQRPDVRAAEDAVFAAVARTRSAQLERLPTINITGELTVESLTAGRIFNPQSLAASLLGSLTVPIFKAGEITANINIQTEQEKQAMLSYEKTFLTALSEVEDALISAKHTAERLAILRRATTAARAAEEMARQRYSSGQIDLLTLLDAERTRLSVEEEQVSTQANLASACIQLYKALGGGWSPLGTSNHKAK